MDEGCDSEFQQEDGISAAELAVIEDFTNKYVAKRIRERRLLCSMSQSDLGRAIGCSFQQIQKYEKGANRIMVGKLPAFARALGVSPDYFMDGLEDALGMSRDSLRDQPQTDWVLDPETVSLCQDFSQLENMATRKHIAGIARDHLVLERLAKTLK